MPDQEDLYEVLQVHHAAEPEVIEAAYKRLLRMYHPDVNNSPEAHVATVRMNRAYEILRDPVRRADYDHQRNHENPSGRSRRQEHERSRQEQQGYADHRRREREADAERDRQGHADWLRREKETQAEKERQEYLRWERRAQAQTQAEAGTQTSATVALRSC